MAHAWLGLVQLLLLSLFVCGVGALNTLRPAGTRYRPFRLNWWVPAVAGAMVLLLLLTFLNLPHYLQHTNPIVAARHAEGRAQCAQLLEDNADHSLRARLFESEWLHDKASAKPSKQASSGAGKKTVIALLAPLLNTLLFNTGVTVAVVPLFFYLGLLYVKARLRDPRATAGWQFQAALLQRESGVLLPVLNLVSVVSAFTSPTFYFFIQPNREDRCIYTSGHWFTFAVTLLTFTVVISHLASYQRYCRSSGRLLAIYILWLAVYLMAAFAVLKRTQEKFHDSEEAKDGIRQALPVFPLYMIIFLGVQYATFITTNDDAAESTTAIDEMAPPATTDIPTTTTTGSLSSTEAASTGSLRRPNPISGPQVAPAAPPAPPMSTVKPAAVTLDAPHSSPSPAPPAAPPMAPPMAPPAPPAPPAPSTLLQRTVPAAAKKPSTPPAPSAPAPGVDSLLSEIRSFKRGGGPSKGVRGGRAQRAGQGASQGEGPTGLEGLIKGALLNMRDKLQPDGEVEDEDDWDKEQ